MWTCFEKMLDKLIVMLNKALLNSIQLILSADFTSNLVCFRPLKSQLSPIPNLPVIFTRIHVQNHQADNMSAT